MNKLTNQSIELINLTRAQLNGQSPSIRLRVLNYDNVANFINESTLLDFLWGNNHAIQTARLNFDLNADNSVLTIRRSVGPQTLADASNQSLADAVLTLIYEADEGERGDIYTGLTGRGIGHYQSSAHIQQLYQSHYQVEGMQAVAQPGM